MPRECAPCECQVFEFRGYLKDRGIFNVGEHDNEKALSGPPDDESSITRIAALMPDSRLALLISDEPSIAVRALVLRLKNPLGVRCGNELVAFEDEDVGVGSLHIADQHHIAIGDTPNPNHDELLELLAIRRQIEIEDE